MSSRNTPILDANKPKNLVLASRILQNGGLVAFPTETVYGLGALGLQEKAVQKIFYAKDRPADNPLILHVNNAKSAKDLFDFTLCAKPKQAEHFFEQFAANFWPGPLTLVCFKKPHVPSLTTAALPKVAVRVPSHPVAQKLLQAVSKPVAAPSANLSTRPSPTKACHVQKTLKGRIDAILDGGPTQHGIESTVVDISNEIPHVLRLGAVPLAAILSIFPKTKFNPPGSTSHQNTASPGLLAKHYAPNVEKIELVDPKDLENFWHLPTALLIKADTSEKLLNKLGQRKHEGLTITLPSKASKFAEHFYQALYQAENMSYKHLVLESFEDSGAKDLSLSLQDRLIRAASPG